MTEIAALAIDLGTSGVKAAVVNRAGRMLGHGRCPLPVGRLPDGGAEQDARAVWEGVKSAMRQALAGPEVVHDQVAAVLCSSQYSSVVPVDAHGDAVGDLILWMDTRGALYNLGIYGEYPDAVLRWLDVHGCPPTPSGNDSLAHMLWVKHERPDIYARTHAFLEPMDFVNAQLTGRVAANQCSTFMMLLTDNRAPDAAAYDAELVRFSGIDREKLPELLPLDAAVGTLRPEVADELGLSPATPVFGAVNDTQAGSIGTGTFHGTHGGLCLGTTTVLQAHVDFKRTDAEHAILTMPSPIPGRYMMMAENGISGAAVDHFLNRIVFAADELGSMTGADRFAALARTVSGTEPGSDGLLFLPWLNGAGAPVFNGNARGGFLNLSLESTRAHMARAVLEGVAFNLRWLMAPAEAFVGHEFSHFVFAGGGAQSGAWAQIMADVVQRPVHQMADAQYVNARGTALLAFLHLGELSLEEIADRCPVQCVYDPSPNVRGRYDLLFSQFVAAYERNAPIFETLNA